MRHIAYAQHVAWRLRLCKVGLVGWGVQKIKKRKILGKNDENGLKQRLLIQLQVGGMMFCMSGCVAVSCHRTHTNTPTMWVGVCLSKLFDCKAIRPRKDKTNKQKTRLNVPFSSKSLFFMFWFIGLSTRPLLFLLRTSKPLGGALDNGSHCSASLPSAFPYGFIVKGRQLPSWQTCEVLSKCADIPGWQFDSIQ